MATTKRDKWDALEEYLAALQSALHAAEWRVRERLAMWTRGQTLTRVRLRIPPSSA